MNQITPLADTMRKLCADDDDPFLMAIVVFSAVMEAQLDEEDITECDELAAWLVTKAGSFEAALDVVTRTLVGLARIADREVAEATEQEGENDG